MERRTFQRFLSQTDPGPCTQYALPISSGTRTFVGESANKIYEVLKLLASLRYIYDIIYGIYIPRDWSV